MSLGMCVMKKDLVIILAVRHTSEAGFEIED